jgi:hypothetical protein
MRNIVIHPLPGGPAVEFLADTLILTAEKDVIPLLEDLYCLWRAQGHYPQGEHHS